MAGDIAALDTAYDRLGRTGFDDIHGYVNHGPMVCEALDALGQTDLVDSWSREPGTPPAHPVEPARFEWRDALGDAARTGEWMGHFERAIETEGWRSVAVVWLPRLLPALEWALFHGAIRTAHAVRAISIADTPARRAELARSLGYWAGGFTPGMPADPASIRHVDDPAIAVVHAAADAARQYRAAPNIIHLHGVTAAMAVDLMMPYLDDTAAHAALAQLHAEHAALYADTEPFRTDTPPTIDEPTLVAAAVASGEAHAIKLVEACMRGHAATGDPAFLIAAERVVRRGLRALETCR